MLKLTDCASGSGAFVKGFIFLLQHLSDQETGINVPGRRLLIYGPVGDALGQEPILSMMSLANHREHIDRAVPSAR